MNLIYRRTLLAAASIALASSMVVGATTARASSTCDTRLQHAATTLIVKLDAVASRYPGTMSTPDSTTNIYIKALRRAIRAYEHHHPQSRIRAAAALFTPPHGHMLLTTNTSAHLDWMASDFVYGPSGFTTLAQVFGATTETYRIFNIRMLIPPAYTADRYQGSLAVYTVSR